MTAMLWQFQIGKEVSMKIDRRAVFLPGSTLQLHLLEEREREARNPAQQMRARLRELEVWPPSAPAGRW